jgi:hypothetical protein
VALMFTHPFFNIISRICTTKYYRSTNSNEEMGAYETEQKTPDEDRAFSFNNSNIF